MTDITCDCGCVFEGDSSDVKCEWCVARYIEALKKKHGYKPMEG